LPALQPVPGVLRCVLRGIADGVTVNNVVHVFRGNISPWTSADAQAQVNSMAATFVTRFISLINNRYTFTGVEGTDLTNNVGVVATAAASSVGTKTGTGTTNATAQCITWKTAAHYRGGHPRMYLFGPGTADITLGTTFVGSHVTALKTAALAWITDVNTGAALTGVAMSLVRRTANKTVLTTPQIFAITSADVDSRIDTQRRRLGKDR
jgi:hypothetical protein